MTRQDDIDDLIQPPGTPEIGFSRGVVVAWNGGTFTNTITVNGATMTNLATLGLADGAIITPGQTVGILRVKSAYYVLGAIAAP